MNLILHDTKSKIFLLVAFLLYIGIDLFYFPSHTIFPDESRFFSEAYKFANTGEFWTGDSRAWEMPFTAIIYGVFVKIFNSYALYSIRIFQAFLLIIMSIGVYQLTYLLFKNKNIALLSMVITLFYPFFIYYQGILLSETLFNTFLIWAFVFLYKLKENNFKIGKFLFLSILFFILGIYIKATLTILPILLIPFFTFLYKGLQYSIKIFGVVLVSYLLLLSFWWIRNYIVLDKFVIFTTSSGANLYLGNNEYNKFGGIDWGKDVDKERVKKIKNSKLSEIEKDKIFKQKAIDYIKNNPDRFFELMKYKFFRFWNIQFNNKNFKHSFYNYIMIFSFTPILIGFLISLFLLKDRLKLISPIFILIFYFSLLHSVVISSLRYRLPIEPFLIILASYSFYFIYKRLK